MPFFHSVNTKYYKTIGSLRADRAGKRVSSPAFLNASMTVEAAFVLPLFIFFMCNILYIFEMIRLESCMDAALHQVGSRVSEYSYYYRNGLNDLSDISDSFTGSGSGNTSVSVSGEGESSLSSFALSMAVSETYVRNSTVSYLGKNYLDHSALEGGSGGISFLRSHILDGNDLIDITADYRVKPFINIMAPNGFGMQARYYTHAWVGYSLGGSDSDSGEDTQEEMVYVTPNGTVYHKSRECTYLKPSIRSVSASDVGSARSSDGSRYYPCEQCRPACVGTLYITPDGNRYHSSPACSCLKRDVREVPLSEVEGKMPACHKCGGG